MLHHILEIASHLHAAERDHNLRTIVSPMKLKFFKYWEDIPLLYSYAFILDPRAKMKGFFNVLQLLAESTGGSYSLYYAEVKSELNKLFTKYETKFGAARSQRVHSHQLILVRKSKHGQRSLENKLAQMLLVLPLHLPPHLVVLLVSSQLT